MTKLKMTGSKMMAFLLALVVMSSLVQFPVHAQEYTNRIYDFTINGKVGKEITPVEITMDIITDTSTFPLWITGDDVTDWMKTYRIANLPNGLIGTVVTRTDKRSIFKISGTPTAALYENAVFPPNATVEPNPNCLINISEMTVAERLAEAKPLADNAISDLTVTNSTTSETIFNAVTSSVSSVSGVTASWKDGLPTIVLATKDNAGSINGTILLICGSESVEVTVSKTIDKLLPTDKEKIDKAKYLADKAVSDLTTTNSTSPENILDTITSGISSVNGVTASWKSNSPVITPATKDNAGSITGTIILTCGSESVEVTVSKTINKLPSTQTNLTITVDGNNSTYRISNGNDMTLTCSGTLEDFMGIYVDDKFVDASNYTLKSGSTILTLKSSFLDTLSVGNHTVKLLYKDDISANIDFTITTNIDSGITDKKPETNNKTMASPKTGDTSNTKLNLSLVVLSGCAVVLVSKRKKALSSK